MKWRDIAGKVNAIEGWLLPGQAQWLFETAQALPDEAVILEIGGYLGLSTAALAFGCVDTCKRVYTIDTFCGNDTDFKSGEQFSGTSFLDKWSENLRALELKSYATAIIGKSSDFYYSWMAKIDFLFIDGSHQYADVLGDLCNFGRHVRPGGIVAMHDVNPLCPWPGPYRVWCEMAETLLDGATINGTLGYGFRNNVKC